MAWGKRLIILLSVVLFLVLWEVTYRLELIAAGLGHPVGIFLMLSNSTFLGRFALMLAQVAFASLFGGGIGKFSGQMIIRSSWLTQATIRFLRLGLWLPFLIYWTLPIWPPREEYVYDSIIWAWLASVTAAALFACYSYLTTLSALELKWSDVRTYLAREVVLQSFLIAVISQFWTGPYSWVWFAGAEVERVYAAALLLVSFVFLLGLVFRSNFGQTAQVRGNILVKEIDNSNWSSLAGAFLLAVLCLVFWQLLSAPLAPYLLISPPLDVFRTVYRLLVRGSHIRYVEPIFWQHIGVSLVETVGGLIFSGVIALIVSDRLAKNAGFRRFAFPLLPLTYVTPIVLPIFVIQWVGGYTGPWRVALGSASLAFFPYLRVFWGLVDRPLACRLLLAIDDALPFALLGAILGEAINAVAGLGYFMVVTSRGRDTIIEGLAAALITVLLLAVLSSVLRLMAKRLCFSTSLQHETSI